MTAHVMWQKIERDLANDLEDGCLSQDILFRLTTYNPLTHGTLFFKNNLFYALGRLDPKAAEVLARMDCLCINHPMDVLPFITYQGIRVTVDRISSAEEVAFLEPIASDMKHVFEIGAGYGRTAEAMLGFYPDIERYTIVDLASVLKLAQRYLSKTLTAELYEKVTFITVDNFNANSVGGVDLVININSMQEMAEEVVDDYLSLISKSARYFYSKNTVGKFAPEMCGFQRNESATLALKAGLLKEEINIFCPDDLRRARERFQERFKPAQNWVLKRHGTSKPWVHYYQALYQKT